MKNPKWRKLSLKTVKCPYCGEELLVVPDVRAMDRAIDTHARHPIPDHDLLSRGVIASGIAALVIDAITIDPAFEAGAEA
jgi:hypothetical protein